VSQIRFMADEDLRRAIVSATRRQEPAIHFIILQYAGLSGRSDEQVLEYAAANQLIVVSHDVTKMRPAAEKRITDGLPMAGLDAQVAAAVQAVRNLVGMVDKSKAYTTAAAVFGS
jgi:hypothetical protein